MNLVILSGTVRAEPRRLDLATGDTVWSVELAPSASGGSPATVVWHGAELPSGCGPGSTVTVVGSVRRRFFRAGGSTQTRTEVVADAIVAASVRRPAAALRAALRVLPTPDGEALRAALVR